MPVTYYVALPFVKTEGDVADFNLFINPFFHTISLEGVSSSSDEQTLERVSIYILAQG